MGNKTPTFDRSDFELADNSERVQIDHNYISQSYWKDAFIRFKSNKGAVVGLIMILIISLFAIVGPMMSDHTYKSVNIRHKSLAPRIEGFENSFIFNGVANRINSYEQKGLDDVYYIFGTDTLGRDLWTRTWMGTRISLYIATIAVAIDMLIGMIYGLVSGYYGHSIDNAMQRFIEILSGIPNLVIVTLLIVILKPGLVTITIALMITGWIGMSRVARAQMLKLKEQEFVLASKTLGAGNFAIIFKDILPNIFGQIIIMSMFSIPTAIFTEAFLAFIGLGIPQPMASLGSLISEGFKSMTIYPYMIAAPVVVLALLMLSFNLLADGLRDALDPKMKEM
ncbi:peptide ABC transporter permease [Cohnella kolymensis]|uniref:Peptide ABC transporter permease n=1 Tax=Cohnella kolymensis TaxID=1590652 RepID=A0ABR5A3T3_9BACL|nr:oligopeptide ABC transporter permease [Cohnella kolymensis]KIL35363.1 peptide ABC transporter permease [Cohnella kolymensis]